MGSIRERAMQSGTRKQKLVDIPEWQDGEEPIAPDGIVVRELDVDQRMAVLSAMKMDGHSGEASVPMNLLAPYLTDLILEPGTGELAFEPADRDYLLTEHPGAASRVLMTSMMMSGLGDEAIERAKGNS